MLRYICMIAALVLAPGTLAHAITLGQTETFETGLGNWSSTASSFSRVLNGGPNGTGDAYLRAEVVSPSLTLSVRNRDSYTWGGNYPAAGVMAIEADLKNCGVVDLQIRLFLISQSQSVFMSDSPWLLPADGLWHTVQFAVSVEGLTPDASDALHSVGSIGFVHQVDFPGTFGTPVIGALGIDNIRAVPEPSSLSAGLLLVLLICRGVRPASVVA